MEKDDLEILDLDNDGLASKPDMSVTQALTEVDKLEEELNEIKEKRKKGGSYADSYASSESNIADMLAEYDSIGREDRPVRRQTGAGARPAASRSGASKAPASGTSAVRSSASGKPASKAAASKAKASKAKASKAKASKTSGTKAKPTKAVQAKSKAAKTQEPVKKSRFADAMYEDVPAKKPVGHKAAEAHRNTAAHGRHASTHATAKRHGAAAHRAGNRAGRGGFSGKAGAWFRNLTGLDYLVAATGIAVLVVAIVVVNIFSNARTLDKKISEFAAIGNDLSGIGTAGEGVLYATANSREVFVPEEPVEEEPGLAEYNEKEDEESGNVTVAMNLQSVVKDLKIKFINKKSGKLIPGIPFKVEVTDANGKTQTYTDDDKDGVIYIAKIQHGDTKVKLVALDGYENYKFETGEQKINVKETLEYKKIDVSDEIKKESQVNAAVEDTAQQTQVEATLTDTVEWVESTKTPIGTETKYVEVKDADIAKPNTKTGIDKLDSLYYRYLMFTEHTWVPEVHADDGSGSDPGTDPGDPETTSPVVTTEPSVTEEPDPSPTAEPSPSPTAEPTPSPTPSPTPTPAPSPTPSPVPSPSPTVKVTPTPTPTPTKAPTKAVTPTPTDKDKKTVLKTTKGEQLYVKSGDKYVAASAADYLSNSKQKFYKQTTNATGYKYTGWQNIDGATYFFNKDGEKVTGEQVIQGAKYTFNGDGVLQAGNGALGIDVSKWNGSIDWTKVRNSGVSYVIIRCGYRGSTTGALIEDPTFRTNIKGATAAGLKVGVYFFTQATNEVEAVEEASMTLNLISGYKISYPVFLDVEGSGGRGDAIDSGTRTAVINAYCKTIANSGYSAGVYANKTWLSQKFNPGALGNAKIWLAQYNTAPTYGGRYNLWQYTSKGKVSGIGGNVDMNLSYLGY